MDSDLAFLPITILFLPRVTVAPEPKAILSSPASLVIVADVPIAVLLVLDAFAPVPTANAFFPLAVAEVPMAVAFTVPGTPSLLASPTIALLPNAREFSPRI